MESGNNSAGRFVSLLALAAIATVIFGEQIPLLSLLPLTLPSAFFV
jgi:hypothetical protein